MRFRTKTLRWRCLQASMKRSGQNVSADTRRGIPEDEAPTGSATDKEVPSSATTMVMIAKVMNARYNRREGFHWSN